MKGKRDFDKAKQLIKEAGYNGEKIVIISATDQPIVHSQTLLTADMLKKLGLNVEIQAGDWGTLITRRTSKEPVEKGGWSIFHTWLVGPDLTNPAVNFADARHGPEGAGSAGRRTRRSRNCATRGLPPPMRRHRRKQRMRCRRAPSSSCPYVPTAQFILPTAYRTNLSGVIIAPIALLWNVEKR